MSRNSGCVYVKINIACIRGIIQRSGQEVKLPASSQTSHCCITMKVTICHLVILYLIVILNLAYDTPIEIDIIFAYVTIEAEEVVTMLTKRRKQ